MKAALTIVGAVLLVRTVFQHGDAQKSISRLRDKSRFSYNLNRLLLSRFHLYACLSLGDSSQ